MDNIRYIVLILMLAASCLGLLASLHQFARYSGTQKANISLGFLLLTFSLSLFNVLLLRTRFFGNYDYLYQVPLWFTLSFGPLLFYYVKFNLFPAYQFRGSDLKHLILPFIQTVVVFWIALQPQAQQNQIWENFLRPIYGPIEYTLFLLFFFLYASLSYRYVRYKLAALRKQGASWEVSKTWGLRKLVTRLAVLAVFYSLFALTDFVAFHFLQRDLYQVNGFVLLGDMAFTTMLFWLLTSTYWKELTYIFRYQKTKNIDFDTLQKQITTQQLHRNSALNTLKLALLFNTSAAHIRRLWKTHTQQQLKDWLAKVRLADSQKLLQHPNVDEIMAVFIAGFKSKKAFEQAQKKYNDTQQ
ncbi:MAG: hypothetical protein AAGI49_03385 [Bacteroidota bacterium]